MGGDKGEKRKEGLERERERVCWSKARGRGRGSVLGGREREIMRERCRHRIRSERLISKNSPAKRTHILISHTYAHTHTYFHGH